MKELKKIKKIFVRLPHRVPGILYEPEILGEESQIGIVLMHSDSDYLDFVPAQALAERGFRVIAANVTNHQKPLDQKLPDVGGAVEILKGAPGIRKIVLLGHSGGATLMTAYQAVAENGEQIFQGPEKIVKMDPLGQKLIPADALMLLDANFGNGAMTLLSIDPSVMDENSGLKIDQELDLFHPANGYDPEGSCYSEAFIRKYQKAQGERMNRLIQYAQDRIFAIEHGKGRFVDDEPMVIPGASQIGPNNKLFPQDIRLLSHTKDAYPLIHADGSVTEQIVSCVRKPRAGWADATGTYSRGACITTVRTFLKSSAVRVTEAYGYNEDSLYGIDWDSSYCCGEGNVRSIHVPTLLIGMTGSYEYIAAETIGKESAAASKKIAFCEGAGHNFDTATETEDYPGQYGDTVKSLFDYVRDWLMEL